MAPPKQITGDPLAPEDGLAEDLKTDLRLITDLKPLFAAIGGLVELVDWVKSYSPLGDSIVKCWTTEQYEEIKGWVGREIELHCAGVDEIVARRRGELGKASKGVKLVERPERAATGS